MPREIEYTTPDYLQRGEVVEFLTEPGDLIIGVVLSANPDLVPETTMVKVLNVFGDRAITTHVISTNDTVCISGELSESAINNYPYREDTP